MTEHLWKIKKITVVHSTIVVLSFQLNQDVVSITSKKDDNNNNNNRDRNIKYCKIKTYIFRTSVITEKS